MGCAYCGTHKKRNSMQYQKITRQNPGPVQSNVTLRTGLYIIWPNLTVQGLAVTICIIIYNITILCILPVLCAYVLCSIITTNIDYFFKQFKRWVYNGYRDFFLSGKNRIL